MASSNERPAHPAQGANSQSRLPYNRHRQKHSSRKISLPHLTISYANQSTSAVQEPENPWVVRLQDEKRRLEFERTGLRELVNEARRKERNRAHQRRLDTPIALEPVSEHLIRRAYASEDGNTEVIAAASHIAVLYNCPPDNIEKGPRTPFPLTEGNLWKFQKEKGFEKYKGDSITGYIEEEADGWEMEKKPTEEEVAADSLHKKKLKQDVIQGWVDVHANQADASWHNELDKAHWDQDGNQNSHSADGGVFVAETPSSAVSEVPQSSKISSGTLAYRPKKGGNGRRNPDFDAPVAPVPTEQYLTQAFQKPIILSKPRRLLLIMDLNGTLLLRKEARKNPKAFRPRPYVQQFLEQMLADHDVMIWSSAREANVSAMVASLFPQQAVRDKLVAIWSREHLDLTPWQFNNKVQVYKRLTRVWGDEKINPDGRYNQTNTLLIDDSKLKAVSEPYNIHILPEYRGQAWEYIKGKEPLRAVEELITACIRWQGDVSAFMKWKEDRERNAVEEVQRQCIEEVKSETRSKQGNGVSKPAPVNMLLKDW